MPKRNKSFLIAFVGAAWILAVVLTSTQPTPVHSQSSPTSVVTLDGRYTYVANFNVHSVSVIENATGTLVTTIPVGRGPSAMSISPDGSTVSVTNSRSKTVCVISVATRMVVRTNLLRH